MIGDDYTSLPRGDLAAAIYDTIDGKVATIFGDSIASVDARDDRVGGHLRARATRRLRPRDRC